MGQIRVLVCDDASGFRALMRYALEQDPGIEVVGEAGDGDEALRAVDALAPDVVLLDLSMPGLDGLGAIEAIRGRRPAPGIVVVSGSEPGERAGAALALGARAYVRKGGDLGALRDTVRASAPGRLT